MRKYNAARGGHAPGHLRDWFVEVAETGEIGDEVREKELTLDWLLGQLWNCRDVMPSDTCHELDLPAGSTYAQAARSLKRR